MARIGGFLRALWRQSVPLLTGGGLLAALAIWQWSGQAVPWWIYPGLLLFTFLAASYRAWLAESDRAETAEAALRANAPHVVAEYSLQKGGQEQGPRVTNLSAHPAHNIQVSPVRNGAARVVFDVLPVLEGHASAQVTFTVEGVGPVFAHSFSTFLSLYPPKTWHGFLKPLVIELETAYTNLHGAAFKTCSRVRYDRGPRKAATVHVAAVT